MGVINPYSQPELENKGWEFKSDDVTVKPNDGSVSEVSLDDDLKERIGKIWDFKAMPLPSQINSYEVISEEDWVRITGTQGFSVLKDIAAAGIGRIRVNAQSETQISWFDILSVVFYTTPVGAFRIFMLLKGAALAGGFMEIADFFYESENKVSVGQFRIRTTYGTYKYFGGTLNESTMYKELVSLLDKQIPPAKIAASAVTEDKIVDDAVTTDKIATGAVTWAKLARNAVHGENIAMETITKDNLQVNAVGMKQLDQAVRDAISEATPKNIVFNAFPTVGQQYTGDAFKALTGVTLTAFASLAAGDTITYGTLSTIKQTGIVYVSSESVAPPMRGLIVYFASQGRIMFTINTQANVVSSDYIKIGTNDIADRAVTQAKIANNSVTADKIGVGAIVTTKIGAKSVNKEKLSDDLQTAMSAVSNLIANGYVYDPSLNFRVSAYPLPEAPTAVPYGRFCTYYYKMTINQKPQVFGILKYEANSVEPIEVLYLEVLNTTSIIREANLDATIKDNINKGCLQLKGLLPTSGTYTNSQIISTIAKDGIESLTKSSALLLDPVSSSILSVGYTRIGNYSLAKGISGKENDVVTKWMYLDSDYNLKFIQGVVPVAYTSITFSEIDNPFVDPNAPKQYELTTTLEDETDMTPDAFLAKYGVSIDVIKGLRVGDSLKVDNRYAGVVAVESVSNAEVGVQLMEASFDETEVTYGAYIQIIDTTVNIRTYNLLHDDVSVVINAQTLHVSQMAWGTTVQVPEGATSILNLSFEDWRDMLVGTRLFDSTTFNAYSVLYKNNDVLYLGMYNEPQTDGTAKQIQYSIRLRYNSDRTTLTSISFYADEIGAADNVPLPKVFGLPSDLSFGTVYSTSESLQGATAMTFADWGAFLTNGSATYILMNVGLAPAYQRYVTGAVHSDGNSHFIVDLGSIPDTTDATVLKRAVAELTWDSMKNEVTQVQFKLI